VTARTFRRFRSPGVGACTGLDERGFSLVEVVASVVMLGIVGAAATYLVIRLTEPRELTIRYEQRSLAARIAAEQIWDLFAQSPDSPPNQCLPFSEEPPESFETLDANFKYAFRCWNYVENGQASETLYRVRVWLQRASDGEIVGAFDMLALLGGYSL